MNAQQITGRMLQSLSASKNPLIDDYLLAFGVTKIGTYTMPPVFKALYEPEWDAFNKHFKLTLHKASAAKQHLYRILEFVRYMQSIGMNPFAKALKHPREAKISSSVKFKPAAVYEKIVENNLSLLVAEIAELMRKNQLDSQFKAEKMHTDVLAKDGTFLIYTSLILTPRKKEKLDSLLTKLQGMLYNGSNVPIQLQEQKQVLPKDSRIKPKILNQKADVLAKEKSFFGWYPVRRTQSFHASLVRARDDKLVFKVLLYIELDVNLGSTAKNTLFKLWKNLSKSLQGK